MTAKGEHDLSATSERAVERLKALFHACEDTLKVADEIAKLGFRKRDSTPSGSLSVITFENGNGMLAVVDENGKVGTCVYRTRDGRTLVIRQSALPPPDGKAHQPNSSQDRYIHAASRSSRTTQRICVNAEMAGSSLPIRYHARPKEVRIVLAPDK